MAFHQIFIQSPCKLSVSNGEMLIKTVDDLQAISLRQIDSLIIDTRQCVLSAPLISELYDHNINVVFEDSHHLPVAGNYRSDLIRKQMMWRKVRKDKLWQIIVKEKIRQQMKLLDDLNLSTMTVNDDNVVIDNLLEAKVSRFYFGQLFGGKFSRQRGKLNVDDDYYVVNSILNYGYSIIMNKLAVLISSYGYLPSIGIHHKSAINKINLACDFVEPFRVIVDNYAYLHRSNEQFTVLNREELVDLLNISATFNAKSFQTIESLMLEYVICCFNYLNDGDNNQNILSMEMGFDVNEVNGHV